MKNTDLRFDIDSIPEDVIVEVQKEQVIKIEGSNCHSFFLINHTEKRMCLISNDTQCTQELDYHAAEMLLSDINEDDSKYINKYVIHDGNKTYHFRYNDKYHLVSVFRDIAFLEDSNIPEENDLPEYFKQDVLFYKKLTIEWVGKNYQVTDYLPGTLVSTSKSIKDVFKDIDEYMEWKSTVSTDASYYKEKGYEIEIINSGKGYPAFPFNYKIHDIKNNRAYDFHGISNVFATKEEAIEKACWKCHYLIEENK